jgi:hypothetical protein
VLRAWIAGTLQCPSSHGCITVAGVGAATCAWTTTAIGSTTASAHTTTNSLWACACGSSWPPPSSCTSTLPRWVLSCGSLSPQPHLSFRAAHRLWRDKSSDRCVRYDHDECMTSPSSHSPPSTVGMMFRLIDTLPACWCHLSLCRRRVMGGSSGVDCSRHVRRSMWWPC